MNKYNPNFNYGEFAITINQLICLSNMENSTNENT